MKNTISGLIFYINALYLIGMELSLNNSSLLVPSQWSYYEPAAQGDCSEDSPATEGQRPPKPGRRRKAHHFDVNATAATAFGPHLHVDNSSLSLAAPDMDTLRKRVKNHAHTRVQLFYYLLVAYFNERCTIKGFKTDLQHGVTACEGCSAAHSSILPNVKDNFFPTLAKRIASHGIDAQTQVVLNSLRVPEESVAHINNAFGEGVFSPDDILQLCGLQRERKLLSKKTHFYRSLNATMELPNIVNECDQVIERNFRVAALMLLNSCSQGKQTPFAALAEFTRRLQKLFSVCQGIILQEIEIVREVAALQGRLKVLERGFEDADDPNSALKEYVRMAAKLCFLNRKWNIYRRHSLAVSWQRDIPCRNRLFENLLNQVMKTRRFVLAIDNRKQLRSYAARLCESFGHMPRYAAQIKGLQVSLESDSYKLLSRRTRQFCAQCDPLDLWFMRKNKVQKTFNLVCDEIAACSDWRPCTVDAAIERLQAAWKINKWQLKGSQIPQLWLDFMEKRSESEQLAHWMEQKAEIIARVE